MITHEHDDFEYLEDAVIEWAHEKGILESGTVEAQTLKMVEEVGEFVGCIAKGNMKDAAMELGDVLVTIILTAELAGLDPTDCLSLALGKIQKRTGKMVGGTFVKEGD